MERSRERVIGDEEWVWEIAEHYDSASIQQGQGLEDRLWKMANCGVVEEILDADGGVVSRRRKQDPKVVERVLAVRDKRYRQKTEKEIHLTLEPPEILERIQAAVNLDRAAKMAAGRSLKAARRTLPSPEAVAAAVGAVVEAAEVDEL